MRPRTAARLELARAVGGGLVSPLRYLAFVPSRARIRAEVRRDVEEGAAQPDEARPVTLRTDRPLRIFLSAAEVSGEIHAAGLVRALRERIAAAGAPAPAITAIGGKRLRDLDVPVIGDPIARAETGFEHALASLPYYTGLLEDAARHARETRPDVVVPVDSPALHVPLARIVRRYGAPVVHLVAPQYWGWAPWRVRAYRRAVDLALTILPHEPAWYERAGVSTRHVGHPLLDALEDVPVTTPDPASRVLAVLPGSRRGVIRRNLPWMLEALRDLRVQHPDAQVVVLQSDDEHTETIEGIAREHAAAVAASEVPYPTDVSLRVGGLHDELARARAAFAVSGTVLTDVLHHRLPTVVVYRVGKRLETWAYRKLLTTPYFASTNLLAGRAVVPEHCFRGEGPLGEVRAELAGVFGDDAVRDAQRAGFDEAARRLGPGGAIDRAAGHVLRLASRRLTP